jgi:uncharacterized protein YbcI
MLNLGAGQVRLATRGDTSLIGCAIETLAGERGSSQIRAITDADAVYAVDDPNVRTRGDHLYLSGATGAQGVTSSHASEFTVVADCPADERTLIRIHVDNHHQIAAKEGLERPTGGELNAAVARAMVRFHRREMGRGPNKARAFYRDDIIIVVLEDLLTTAERSLVARGKHDAVMQLRAEFQNAIREDMVAVIEDLTGAKVRAFMSSNHLDPDMALEAFVLDQPIWGESPAGMPEA